MKHTKNMIINDTVESRELTLYAVNNERVYTQSIVPVLRNLQRKKARGIYDATKAIDAFYYVADFAAQLYNRDFGGHFTVTERYTAAARIAECFADEI